MDETNRWRMALAYRDVSVTPFASETRMKLALRAARHGWRRLARWVEPKSKFKTTYSPEMLGNQPAPLAP